MHGKMGNAIAKGIKRIDEETGHQTSAEYLGAFIT